MSVMKNCKYRGCRASPRCQHEWFFDIEYKKTRDSMRVNEYARCVPFSTRRWAFLDAGEREALALAEELHADQLSVHRWTDETASGS